MQDDRLEHLVPSGLQLRRRIGRRCALVDTDLTEKIRRQRVVGDLTSTGDGGAERVVKLSEVRGAQGPGMVDAVVVQVAVIDVAGVAAEQRTQLVGLILMVNWVRRGQGGVGPLLAELGCGGEQLGIGTVDGAVHAGHHDVDIGVIAGARVLRVQYRHVVLAVPVRLQGALQPVDGHPDTGRYGDSEAVGLKPSKGFELD